MRFALSHYGSDEAMHSRSWGLAFSMKPLSTRQLLITFVPSIAILLAVVAVSVLFQVNLGDMTKDVATIAGIHPLKGFLSNLGILLWCATTSICAFAAVMLSTSKPRERFWFLLCSALLSAYLLFDDFFMFHDFLARRYLGLKERVVVAFLGIAVAVYLIAFRRVILRTDFYVLLLALCFLGTSAFIDVILERWLSWLGQWEFLIEDGAKWLGIASWCSYYAYTSYQFLASTFHLPGAHYEL